MTPGRCCRALRAAMFAATCVLLAALGHILMSGTAVPWWAMAAAFAGTGATAWALARQERGILVVTSASVAVQAVLHCGFSLAQATVRPSLPESSSFAQQWAQYLLCGAKSALRPPFEALRVASDAGLGRHLHHASPGGAGTLMPGGGGHTHHSMDAMADSTATLAGHGMAGMSPVGMPAAHLLAALLCGLWLAYGEQAAFRVLRAFAGWLIAPVRLLLRLPAPAHRPRIRDRRAHRARALRQFLLVHAITSRGPPVGAAVV